MTSSTPENDRDGPATEGMGGSGYYDNHSQVQRSTVVGQAERLRNAVRHLDLTADELRVIDYGCGPGRNSMAAFHKVFDEVGVQRPGMPVVAVHNDQFGNDWNDLFANIRGPDGYLRDFPSTRIEASVESFYDPVASADTIDLGMSFMAVHWLNGAIHMSSPGTLFFCDVEGPAREELAARAADDWRTFFAARAGEMRSGAWLVIETLASVPDANDPSGLLAAGRWNYRACYRIAEAMADEGLVKRDLLDNFVFPVYFRDEKEARAPFDEGGDLQDVFEVVEVANELYPTPFEETFKQDGDAAAYASAYVGYVRAYSESTLRGGLFEGSAGSADEANALTNEFYDPAGTPIPRRARTPSVGDPVDDAGPEAAMTRADGKPSRRPATDGMAGSGFYDGHSREQAKVIRGEADRLRGVAAQLDLSVPELRIVDYGCGPGRNSMVAFHVVLDAVRHSKPDLPVVAVHNDQIGNDWNNLFANVRGPGGYLRDHPSVRVEASIASFYDSVEGAGTVDLGMSFVAAHWLSSALRLSSPDTLFFADMTGGARDEIAALADQDWTSFLRHRAREIKSGGWLVVHVFSSVRNPDDPSGLQAAGRHLFRAFWRIANGMADDGLIDRDLLDTFVFPCLLPRRA